MTAIIIGVIVDTATPALFARLLGDLEELAALERGRATLRVVALDNPGGVRDDAAVASWQRRLGLSLQVLATESKSGFRLPIAVARTRLQRACAAAAERDRACVWILDEDLRLTPLLSAVRCGLSLGREIAAARARGDDVLLSPIIGAPPLPARSTVRVNLEDLHRHLADMAGRSADAPWPDRRADNQRVRQRLAEFYYDYSCAHEDAAAFPMWLEPASPGESVRQVFLRLCAGAGLLQQGQPLTRPVCVDGGAHPLPKLARGGNTLVLRTGLLARFPNPIIWIGGRAVRRSDMLWARLVTTLGGARLGSGRLVAQQDRGGPGHLDFSAEKLLDDVRGSALVKALDELLVSQTRSLDGPLACYRAHRHERLAQIERTQRLVRARLSELQAQLQEDLALKRVWYSQSPECRDAMGGLLAALGALDAAYDGQDALCGEEDEVELQAIRTFLGRVSAQQHRGTIAGFAEERGQRDLAGLVESAAGVNIFRKHHA